MAIMQSDDQDRTNLGLAALFVALARTLDEQDGAFLSKFDDNIEKIYRQMEDYKNEPTHAMETLRWAHELLGQKS